MLVFGERGHYRMKMGLKKWVAGIALASVVWTGATWSPAPASAASSPFSDVAINHWAQKHVSKLALQGILKGDGKGKFNPSNPVSREEAVIIALRFMGIDSQAKASDATVLPAVLKIRDAYKHYLDLAFQKKLLLLEEEVEIAQKEPAKSWGSSPATREWITRVLVRAIGKDVEATEAASKTTSFSDDAKIDAKLRGYVNVAIATGLVKGVTTTTFQPTGEVTRATASTLFSRAQSEVSVAYAGQVKGLLFGISADKLTLLHQDGSLKDYPVTDNTSFYRFDSEQSSSLAALMLYTDAVLINGDDGKIAYVEQMGSEQKVKTYEGRFERLTPAQSRVTLLVGDDYVNYYYDPSYPPAIADTSGNKIELSDLPVGVSVKLIVDAVRAEGKIVAITVKQAVVNKSGSGTIEAYTAATRTLQVKDAATGTAESYVLAKNATIKLNGVNQAEDALKIGDSITYEVRSGEIAAVVITKTEQPTVSGVLELVNKTNKSIQYTANGKLQADYLADNIKVKIEGFANPTIDDLMKGDAISLTLNDERKVAQITVTNRSVKTLIGATVGSYVDSEKTLIVYDSAGAKYNFNITASTRFDLNGTDVSLDIAKTIFATKGKKLNISYTDDDAVIITLIARYSGTITEINTISKTIKLALDASNSMTIPYVSPYIEINGKATSTLTDLKLGDSITVIMNNNQDQAGSILVHQNAQFEVVSVDLISNRLRVKDSAGSTIEWSLTSSVVIQDDSGAPAILSSLTAGSTINVALQGKNPAKIKLVSVAVGRVSAVNASDNSITIVTSTGQTVTKQVGSNPVIKRDNVVLSSLGAVVANDRVEIGRDENDRISVNVATTISKPFWRIDSVTKLLYVKSQLASEPNGFVLHPQIYIHQGDKVLGQADLKIDEAITLYVIKGKAVEIAK